jgi:single-stranded DNA-binding protein
MSLNKGFVIGHLGQDPEIPYTASGMRSRISRSRPTRPTQTKRVDVRSASNGTGS